MGEFAGIILALGLLAGMLALLEVGYRLARRYQITRGDDVTSIFDTAIFALLGLLLAFAFSGSMDRLKARRNLIVAEANAIGTAYLRVDLLPAAEQPAMRAMFKDYLGARLDLYRVVDGGGDGAPGFARIDDLQKSMWRLAVSGVSRPETQYAAEVVLPALNEMIDLTTTRKVALGTHLSELVLVLLCVLSLISAFMAGAAMAQLEQRRLVNGGIYAVAVALTVYTILDLDNPRGGLIRMDAAEHALTDLHASISQPDAAAQPK